MYLAIKRCLIIFPLLFAPSCFAQLAPQDGFGGRTDVPAGSSLMPDHETFPVNCSKTTTSESCTVTNSTITSITQSIPTAAVTYNVVISSPSLNFNIAVGEPGCGSGFGSGNTMNYSGPSTDNQTQAADHITSVTTGSPGVITFTTFASSTQSAANGNMTLRCGFYPAIIHTPEGTGPQIADPLNNWFFYQGVAGMGGSDVPSAYGAFNTNSASRYGSACSAAQEITADFKQYMFFNAVANDSALSVAPNGGTCSNFQPLPGNAASDADWATAASIDRFGFADQAIKDINYLVNRNLPSGPVAHHILDIFDSRFNSYVLRRYGSTSGDGLFTGKHNCYGAPSCLGWKQDDTDEVNVGGDPGITWPTRAGNTQGLHPGFMMMIAATRESVQIKQNFLGCGTSPCTLTPTIFGDTINYSKHLRASAPSACWAKDVPATAPCSLADFLRDRYTNHIPSCAGANTGIAALNACWGSNYTGFGSAETVVASENIGSGDGTTTTFTHTFANGHVTIGSVQIFVNGNLVAGDCPVALVNSGCTGSAGGGSLVSPRTVQRSLGYGTGQFVVNSDINVVKATSGYNSKTASSAPTTCTTINCTYTDGAETFSMNGPSVTNASTITYGATSSLSVTFANAPPVGTNNITVGYTFGGYGDCASSCGAMDEDGSHTAWMGTHFVCLLAIPTFQANHTYNFGDEITDPITKTTQIVMSPGTSAGSTPSFSGTADVPTVSGGATFKSMGQEICGPDAGSLYGNADIAVQAGIDLDDFIYQITAQYEQTSYNAVKQMFPGLPFDGLDSWGNSGTPATHQALEVANIYEDLPQTVGITLNPNGGDVVNYPDPLTVDKYIWESFYIPNRPLTVESFYQSTQSVTGGCDNPCIYGYTTQTGRGQAYYTYVHNILNQVGYNNIKNLAGIYCWSCVSDIQGHGYGLESQSVNPIDGVTDVAGAVSCPNGFGTNACGGEPGGTVSGNWSSPYGFNAILGTNGVQVANKLWLMGLAPSSSPAPTRKATFAGVKLIDPAWIAKRTNYETAGALYGLQPTTLPFPIAHATDIVAQGDEK